MTAPQAAGVIHTDFEKGFIRAQTISYQNLIDSGSIANAKTRGLLRSEGKEYVVKEGGLSSLIRSTYKLLGLKTYFTTGEKETKAWTIKDGMTAPQAAGVIHTDFEKGFIRAQTISYQNLIDSGSIANAKTKGLLRSEGKEYIVNEGDVMEFLFNV